MSRRRHAAFDAEAADTIFFDSHMKLRRWREPLRRSSMPSFGLPSRRRRLRFQQITPMS